MQTDLIIRPIRDGEKAAAQQVMRRAFSPPTWLFFSWGKDVLVAEHEGRIVGGVVLKIFVAAKRKVGFVSWLFTDPTARGLGAGQALVENALAFFEAQGCTEFSACVEGYNTSSSKVFATRGFEILSAGEQLRRYGLGILLYWWHSYHLIDVGHFLWVKPGAERPDSPALQWVGTWLVNTLLLWLAVWRAGGVTLALLWTVPLAFLLLFGLRSLAMWGAARVQGLPMRFRAWESSATLVTAMALFFGGFFPFSGSFYPVEERWRYRELLPKIGPMALAGTLATLTLAWGSWAALRWGVWPGLQPLFSILMQLSRMLAMLETVIAFFPLISLNGRRIWDWNRVIWVLVSLAAVALIVASRI